MKQREHFKKVPNKKSTIKTLKSLILLFTSFFIKILFFLKRSKTFVFQHSMELFNTKMNLQQTFL